MARVQSRYVEGPLLAALLLTSWVLSVNGGDLVHPNKSLEQQLEEAVASPFASSSEQNIAMRIEDIFVVGFSLLGRALRRTAPSLSI